MSFEPGAGFRIVGHVVRRFVAPSGKVVFLTLDVPNGRGGFLKIEARAFDGALIEEIGSVNDGALIQVTGGIDMETIKGKDRQPVKVDGRDKWVPSLTIRKFEIAPATAKPKPAARASDDW